MEFGYWGFKGRGQPHRILMAYLGLDIPEAGFSTPQEWAAKKEELRKNEHCAFPNLPYLKDGTKVVTESSAVAQALVNKANRSEMFGKSPTDQIIHTSMLGVCNDLFDIWGKFLGKTRSELQASWSQTVEKEIRPKLEGFCKILGSRPFFLYYLTYADIFFTYLCEIFDYTASLTGVSNPFNEFAPLIAHRKAVLSLPGIKEYQSHSSNQRPVIPDAFVKYATS